jgi:hypothetical protein
MRTAIIVATFAAAFATGAAAQPKVLIPSKPIHGTVPDFQADLPSKVMRWQEEETQRQFEEPTTMFDLEYSLLENLQDDIERVAKRKKLSFEEVEVLVMYNVITGAAKKLDKAVHERRNYVEDNNIPDKQDVELRSLGRRKAVLLELIHELGPRMTPNTRLLAGDSGSAQMLNLGARSGH